MLVASAPSASSPLRIVVGRVRSLYKHTLLPLASSRNGIAVARACARFASASPPEPTNRILAAQPSLDDFDKAVESTSLMITRLEELAPQRPDPEKLRWRRLLGSLARRSGLLTPSHAAHVLAILAVHPLALGSPSGRQLAQCLVGRLQQCVHVDMDDSHFVEQAWALVQFFGTGASTAAMQTYFWVTLMPLALDSLVGMAPGDKHALLLMSLAVAWSTRLEGAAWSSIQPRLRDLMLTVFNDEAVWRSSRFSSRDGSLDRLAHLACACGLLEQQGAVSILSEGAQHVSVPTSRVLRLLHAEQVRSCSLEQLVLLRIGLKGLRLEKTRLGTEVRLAASRLIRRSGIGGASPSEVCVVLLLLRTCRQLAVNDSWAYALLQSLANSIDKLQRAEKAALRIVLEEYAATLGIARPAPRPGLESRFSTMLSSVYKGKADELVPHDDCAVPASLKSREAAIGTLSRYDWFARRSRAQVSWHGRRKGSSL